MGYKLKFSLFVLDNDVLSRFDYRLSFYLRNILSQEKQLFLSTQCR